MLAKVILGEADAGMVYRSDALAGGRNVRSVAVPAAFNVVARYPITVVTGTGKRDLAVAWIGFVMGSEGQEILVGHGFGAAK